MENAALPKNPWTRYVDKFLDRLHLRDSRPASPQRELYEKALSLKAANQHAFMPQGRGVKKGDVIIGSSLFVKFNPWFPHNPCYVERGIDWKTYKALRMPAADVEPFFDRLREDFARRWQNVLPMWMEPGRGTLKWWAAFGARFAAGKQS